MRNFKIRGNERITHLRKLSIHALDHGCTADGHTIDLSRSGTKFFTELSLSAGDVVEMTWGDRDPAVTLGGRVVYVKSDAHGLFVGVRFHQALSPAAFRELREHRDVAAYGLRRGKSTN